MKRAIIFVWLLLLCGRHLDAQLDTPPPFPTQPMPSAKPSAPAQAIVPVPITPPRPNGKIQNSLVRITVTEAEPDYRAPWNAGAIQRGVGAGFVIDGSRIMTNAHVVSNSRYLTVEREGDPNKYPATVQFVAHDCDLALITVSVPGFFKNMTPLKFGGIPELESTVSAYGYPIGGERMSVTTGIVSRIDFQLYTHSSIDQHLRLARRSILETAAARSCRTAR
jgi:S1-C subfamily serine protease